MKLVALWVEDFMKIKNTGFNFGSKLIFDFDFDEEKRELRISAEPTPDYYDLFAGSGISNVSGVIGTNGSGKTTLLKILNLLYANKPLMSRIVTIYENEDSSKFEIYNYKNTDLTFGDKKKVEISLPEHGEFSNAMKKKGTIIIKVDKYPFENVDLIFYSNLYSDQNDNYLGTDNQLNRSVNYQTIKSIPTTRLKEYIKAFESKEERRVLFNEESYNPLSLYHYDKLSRLIRFLADVNHDQVLFFQEDIKFPTEITVWLNESLAENTFKVADSSVGNFKKIREIFKFYFSTYDNEPDAKQRFKNQIIFGFFFFSFYNDFFKRSEKYGGLDDIEKFINELGFDKNIYQNIKQFMLLQVSPRKKSEIDAIRSILEQLDSLLEKIEVNFPDSQLGRGSFELSINKDLWGFLSKILLITDHKDEPLLNVNLNPFSAGEGAVLGQFSEYYEALKFITKETVIVSIDEGELYMHPAWQRKYVNALFQFFSYFAKSKNKSFQIIVTSHSPFLVSDIPKYNLVFMEKDENGLTEIRPSGDHKPTLGGNIFELFQDGFYMKEFIGEFAFNKINEAINFLNDKKSTFHNLAEVESFVKLIGEDIIRSEIQRVIDLKKIKDFDKYFELVTDDKVIVTDLKENKKDNKKGKND
jgi:predicted ATP-dependent endonuclease of OLD family